MTMPSIPISALATGATLPQVAGSLGLPTTLSPDQVIALLQAVADLRTSAALQQIATAFVAGGAVNERIAKAMELGANASDKIAAVELAANPPPVSPPPPPAPAP